jgi:hypothetical protein
MGACMQKSSTAESSKALPSLGVLQTVLSYVGPGHYLFVALVSKSWRDIYDTLESQQLTGYNSELGSESTIACVPQMPLFSSVLASPARVKLAHKFQLDCTSQAYQYAAGRHADTATLKTAHKLGMQYSSTSMRGAADCYKLAEMQHLHRQGCPWPRGLLKKLLEVGALSCCAGALSTAVLGGIYLRHPGEQPKAAM